MICYAQKLHSDQIYENDTGFKCKYNIDEGCSCPLQISASHFNYMNMMVFNESKARSCDVNCRYVLRSNSMIKCASLINDYD